MSKITVHPDALTAAHEAYITPSHIHRASFRYALQVFLQWYIDHPQISVGQLAQLRGEFSFDGTRKFREKFLTLALSGKPEVPQELRDAFGNWETMDSVERDELVKAYNLGKGAK